MKRLLVIAVVLLGAGALAVLTSGAGGGSGAPTYNVELDNAFGLVKGADVKVAGVRAGAITGLSLDQRNLKARVEIEITQAGFGAFRAGAFCESKPQSLIGEYFIDCQPGRTGRALPSGGTIPVSHTATTIAPDLVQNVLRLPYRERLRLIIDELGAGLAGHGPALNDAIRRASPALRETDRVLGLLATENQTLRDLTQNGDTVVTALARNRRNVGRFIVEARNTARASAARRGDLQATFHKFPALLTELRPTMAALGRTADAQLPSLRNLDASATNLHRFFTDLRPFSDASRPAVRSLGRASVTGEQAVKAAGPTIALLTRFAAGTPELAQNLAIVLHDLDDRRRAVERDPRSPGGRGYTGLEALLQYAFNQSVAVNAFDQNGHLLRVDGFAGECAPYQNAETLKAKLAADPKFKHCVSTLGPSQPGLNQPDPSPAGAQPASASSAAVSARPAPANRRARRADRLTPELNRSLDQLFGSRRATRRSAAPATSAAPAARAQNDPRQLLDYLLAP